MSPLFNESSLQSARALPNDRVQSSTGCDWTSLLVERHRSTGVSDVFETLATPDQTIVVALSGEHELSSARDSGWTTNIYRPGSVGLTGGGEVSRLRWRGLGRLATFETAHLYLPQQYVAEATERLTGSGRVLSRGALSAAVIDDASIAQTVRALIQAMEAGESDLYAQAAAQWLAVHLVSRAAVKDARTVRHYVTERLSDQRLARVLNLIQESFAEPLSIDVLAAAACISKHHFLRVFTRKVGVTPHEYLTQVRLSAAREQLARTDLPVAAIARGCGYTHLSSFSAAFLRVYGVSPSAYRQAARSR
jgi:AraC family transcriptional regulator